MTPNQIEPGTLYRHKSFPDTVYLGCADHFDYFGMHGEPRRKFLLILRHSNIPKKLCGIKVYHNAKIRSNREFWAGFYKAK